MEKGSSATISRKFRVLVIREKLLTQLKAVPLEQDDSNRNPMVDGFPLELDFVGEQVNGYSRYKKERLQHLQTLAKLWDDHKAPAETNKMKIENRLILTGTANLALPHFNHKDIAH